MVGKNKQKKKKRQQHAKKHALTPEMKKRKWKKGISGNPGGRPKGSGLTDLLLKEIEKVCPTDKRKKTWKQLIVEATMRLAIKGNSAALKEVWDRVDGKVDINVNASDSMTGYMAIMAKLWGDKKK